MTRRKVLAPLGIVVAVIAVVLGVTFGVRHDSRAVALAGATDAQLVVRASSNDLMHTIRSNANRTWTEAGDLLSQTGRPAGTITHIASTVINGELNIVASDSYGVYLAIRHTDGNWEGLQRIATCANVTSLAAATVSSDLQIVVATDNGAGLYHAVRHSDGTWTSFGDVKAVAGGLTGTIGQVGAAGVNGQLQVVALAGGKVMNAVRDAGGNWTPFADVLASNDPNHVVGTPSGVAVGAAGNALQLLVQGGNGTTLWHMVRDSAGNWGGPGDAMKAMGHKGTLVSVAVAGVNGDLQVAIVDNGGAVWHTIRHSADGTWDQAGQLTPSIVPGMPSDVVEAAIAGS
ncbi:hypothetical protein [Kutzneria buriramensis]|uniref:Uncharacterized protein n=1 Tax=Kutzneria buriramensis TaxID=1045776 RepID=A0A3E0GTM4_9PSEU|nr:hypothetical protein [Kutzneria buriramensis]REH26201.1 hypothetical protein BCF44_13456 [Kutzneria buriramensis]